MAYKPPVKPEPIPVPDFELFVGDKGGLINNGDVPIRWCITQEYIKQLEEDGVIDPHVLITSYAPSDKKQPDKSFLIEMDRKMVPLTELMTYLRFSRAGKAKVYAVILDGCNGREVLHKRYLRNKWDDGGEIISPYSDEIYDDLKYAVKTISAMVIIPADVFGKEPSAWTKWYVNLWHKSSNKVVDECHWRQRWMIAFGVKWMAFIPFLIIGTLFRISVATGLSLMGYSKIINFWKSFRMYKYPCLFYSVVNEDIGWIKDNFFIRSRKNLIGNYPYGETTPLFNTLAFTPVTFILIVMLVSLVKPDGVEGYLVLSGIVLGPLWVLFLLFDLLVLCIEFAIKHGIGKTWADKIFDFLDSIPFKVMLIAVLAYLTYQAGMFLLQLVGMALLIGLGTTVILIGTYFLFNTRIMRWILNLITISPEQNNYTNIHELLCPKDEDNLRPNIKFIPKDRRTIRLWYLNVKNKMCKPMQQ